MTDGDAALAAFEGERRRLFGIAYRMLGSVREAEDVLQDAWIRWQEVEHAAVANPAAYLVRLVTRLCIDTLKAARSRRLEYVGPWLPEPLVEDRVESESAEEMLELADTLSTAFLLMLERLGPVERAVFLLRESFDFPFAEIARVVGRTEENCRQIDRRARLRLADERRARPAGRAEHDRLLAGFLRATREGDLDGLLQLLSDEAVAYSDGGGKATAARNPITGARNVARFFLGLANRAAAMGLDLDFRLAEVNGRTGVLVHVGGHLHSVITLYAEEGRILRFFTVVNPDKLPALA
ncbi:MAG TPA: RNA polymerase sigma-70 factor [Longimicrobium sp.]|nr:RNA polymerase sigma-70 factor [Longimicrobium sp.]